MRVIKRYFLAVIIVFFAGSVFLSVQNCRKTRSVRLCVKDSASEHLVLQKTIIPKSSSAYEKVFWILKELISGPTESRYERILDPNIEIQRIVIRKGIAYISFDWNLVDSLYENPRLVIGAITNSILLNIRQIKGVKILIEDVEPVITMGGVCLGNTLKNNWKACNKILK
jgi:hypothetical protein